MSKYYSLPAYGKFTKDIDESLREWENVASSVEKILDVYVIGFDPGFLCKRGEVSFTIPLSVGLRLQQVHQACVNTGTRI